MTRQPHNAWYAEVTELQRELDSSPDNLELAESFWALISGAAGYDVRDGKRVVDTFRTCALKSDDGLAELVSAFRKLTDDSGEYPRAALFDPPLENLIRIVAHQSDHPLNKNANWLIAFLDADE